MFGVYFKDKSIGNKGISLVHEFDTVEAARKKAKGLNSVLSVGEKKYYGMKYTVRAIK